jgi:hypothetical protein
VFWVDGRKEWLIPGLDDLFRYSTNNQSNAKWVKSCAEIPVKSATSTSVKLQLNIFMTLLFLKTVSLIFFNRRQLVFYGYCGTDARDTITIDDIKIVNSC